MDRKLMIKLLELLEQNYAQPLKANILMKELGLQNIDGEFSKVIKYLKETGKIKVVLVPEERLGLLTRREKLQKWLQKIDEITITPEGIDFLTDLKELQINKAKKELSLRNTIVLTQIAIIGISFAIFEKFDLDLSASFNIPFILSVIIWVVLIAFIILFVNSILQIIFSRESWKGILFDRD